MNTVRQINTRFFLLDPFSSLRQKQETSYFPQRYKSDQGSWFQNVLAGIIRQARLYWKQCFYLVKRKHVVIYSVVWKISILNTTVCNRGLGSSQLLFRKNLENSFMVFIMVINMDKILQTSQVIYVLQSMPTMQLYSGVTLHQGGRSKIGKGPLLQVPKARVDRMSR